MTDNSKLFRFLLFMIAKIEGFESYSTPWQLTIA